jgi:hypothetical protein
MSEHRFKIGQRVIPSALGMRHGKISGGIVAAVDLDGFVRLEGAPNAAFSPLVFEPVDEAPTFTVTRIATRPLEIPAIDIHRERTQNLGAHRFSRNEHSAITLSPADSAAWSAHLRCLVKQSAQRDAAQAPSVGWDPFGDDA